MTSNPLEPVTEARETPMADHIARFMEYMSRGCRVRVEDGLNSYTFGADFGPALFEAWNRRHPAPSEAVAIKPLETAPTPFAWAWTLFGNGSIFEHRLTFTRDDPFAFKADGFTSIAVPLYAEAALVAAPVAEPTRAHRVERQPLRWDCPQCGRVKDFCDCTETVAEQSVAPPEAGELIGRLRKALTDARNFIELWFFNEPSKAHFDVALKDLDAALSEKQPLPTIRCDQCDNGIEPEWPFCAWCGEAIGENVIQPIHRGG